MLLVLLIIILTEAQKGIRIIVYLSNLALYTIKHKGVKPRYSRCITDSICVNLELGLNFQVRYPR